MSFDEQPDGDPHGECAAEIHRLTDENKTLRDTLRGIVEADYRKWEELARPEEFVRWAKSRAQHTLVAVGAYSDGMTAQDDRRFLEATSGLAPNAKVTGSPASSASPRGLPG